MKKIQDLQGKTLCSVRAAAGFAKDPIFVWLQGKTGHIMFGLLDHEDGAISIAAVLQKLHGVMSACSNLKTSQLLTKQWCRLAVRCYSYRAPLTVSC
jgi:hypothetical protein